MAEARRVEGYAFEPEYTEAEILQRRAAAAERNADVNQPNIDIRQLTENCSCDGGCTNIALETEDTLGEEIQKYICAADTRQGVICCRQIPRVQRFLRQKPDISNPQCITEHKGFKDMCLNRIVLETNHKLYLVHRRRAQNLPDVFSNQELRYTAYRNFSSLIYKKLGKNNRRCLPICALIKIRSNYPENDENNYVGYKTFNPLEVQAALNA